MCSEFKTSLPQNQHSQNRNCEYLNWLDEIRSAEKCRFFSTKKKTNVDSFILAVYKNKKPAVNLVSFCVKEKCGVIAIYQKRKRKTMSLAEIDIEKGKTVKTRVTIFKKVIFRPYFVNFHFRKPFKNALPFKKVFYVSESFQKCSFSTFSP